MDRRNAVKLMGLSLATTAMAGIAPLTHAAILKDRKKDKKRMVFYFTASYFFAIATFGNASAMVAEWWHDTQKRRITSKSMCLSRQIAREMKHS